MFEPRTPTHLQEVRNLLRNGLVSKLLKYAFDFLNVRYARVHLLGKEAA